MSQFSFVDDAKKQALHKLIASTPNAANHLRQKCHTLILTMQDGESYFCIQQTDKSYGFLKVIDPVMHLTILLQGGDMCGYGHIKAVADFLMEASDEISLTGSDEKKHEFAVMATSIAKLLVLKAIMMSANFVALMNLLPEDFPSDYDIRNN